MLTPGQSKNLIEVADLTPNDNNLMQATSLIGPMSMDAEIKRFTTNDRFHLNYQKHKTEVRPCCFKSIQLRILRWAGSLYDSRVLTLWADNWQTWSRKIIIYTNSTTSS